MKQEIKSWITGKILFKCKADDVCAAVLLAYKAMANLRGAGLRRANLSGASLSGANLREVDLRGADIRGASLREASLRKANLRGADLREADLSEANLGGADLRGTNLYGADLRGANLREADLSGAVLPTGEKWEAYKVDVIPALLAYGGVPLTEIVTNEHWSCHEWGNCPLSTAFKCHGIEGVPILLRQRTEQFIQFFDAGLIPILEIT